MKLENQLSTKCTLRVSKYQPSSFQNFSKRASTLEFYIDQQISRTLNLEFFTEYFQLFQTRLQKIEYQIVLKRHHVNAFQKLETQIYLNFVLQIAFRLKIVSLCFLPNFKLSQSFRSKVHSGPKLRFLQDLAIPLKKVKPPRRFNFVLQIEFNLRFCTLVHLANSKLTQSFRFNAHPSSNKQL